MAEPELPIACDLGALRPDERARRAELAHSLVSKVAAVRDLADGYALRLEADRVRDSLEWFLLERRCCPFLRLELELEPAGGPLWLRLRGGPGVKEFLADAGLAGPRATPADSSRCC